MVEYRSLNGNVKNQLVLRQIVNMKSRQIVYIKFEHTQKCSGNGNGVTIRQIQINKFKPKVRNKVYKVRDNMISYGVIVSIIVKAIVIKI